MPCPTIGDAIPTDTLQRSTLETWENDSFGVESGGQKPGDQLQKCRSPVPTKVQKKCFGKCRPQTGCRGKCRKKRFSLQASLLLLQRLEGRSTFFGTFLGTPFGAGTFRSTFSALLSGRGFGSKSGGQKQNTVFLNDQPFGHPRDIPAKSWDTPPKSLSSLGFEGHAKLFRPPPLHIRGRPPPHQKIFRTQKFESVLLSLA